MPGMPLIYSSLTLATLLILWFQTHAFGEYTTLCSRWLPKWVKDFFILEEFEKVKSSGLDYPSFLTQCFPEKFQARLMSCPMCLSVWLSAVLSFYYGLHLWLPTVALGLFFYTAIVIMLTHGK